jgi:carbon monoxide dehydrogenase subunit G
MADTPAAARPALLFMPDISGFTQFVAATEIEHSRHIVEELLETLIDANDLGLEVSEVEGDAILFYRFGEAPDARRFFSQVERMFTAFHAQLRRFDTHRLCRCGACAGAGKLTLKIVAHYGTVSQSRVKQHSKLFGTDVIAVHRLLKNAIPHHEYALFTRPLDAGWAGGEAPDWAPRETGSGEYDLGRIDYGYVALAPRRERVPPPPAAGLGLPGRAVPAFSLEQTVEAPMEQVFGVVTDLDRRMNWIEGAKRVEQPDPGVNHVGTRHRCVVDATSPMLVTSAVEHRADSVTFTETDEKRMGAAVFAFHRDGEAKTRVRVDFLVRDSLLAKALFALLLRRKLERLFRASLANLARYCKEQYAGNG